MNFIAALLAAASIWGYGGVQFTVDFLPDDATNHATARGTIANCHVDWNHNYVNWSIEDLLPIAIHEYGHCISIPHSFVVQSIMYPNTWLEGGLTWGQPDGQRIMPNDRAAAWWALRDPEWGMLGVIPGTLVAAGIHLAMISVDSAN